MEISKSGTKGLSGICVTYVWQTYSSSSYGYPVEVTKTVHHDAVYEDRTITVTDKEAWTEHWKECTTCGAIEK